MGREEMATMTFESNKNCIESLFYKIFLLLFIITCKILNLLHFLTFKYSIKA